MNGILRFTENLHDFQKQGYYENMKPSVPTSYATMLPFFFTYKTTETITVTSFKLITVKDEKGTLIDISEDDLGSSSAQIKQSGEWGKTIIYFDTEFWADRGLYQYEITLSDGITLKSQPFCVTHKTVTSTFSEFTTEFNFEFN
jgi:hypothetical protein